MSHHLSSLWAPFPCHQERKFTEFLQTFFSYGWKSVLSWYSVHENFSFPAHFSVSHTKSPLNISPPLFTRSGTLREWLSMLAVVHEHNPGWWFCRTFPSATMDVGPLSPVWHFAITYLFIALQRRPFHLSEERRLRLQGSLNYGGEDIIWAGRF